MKAEIFTEVNYAKRMQEVVEPWKEACLKRIGYTSYDGTHISAYYALHPNARAAIVAVHGFTEFTEKFSEVLYHFYEEGYSVFMTDQRGHGRSGRKVSEPWLVYVKDFDEYVEDLYFFIDRVVRKEAPGLPLYLYAHSMGGCIGTLFLEKYTDVFQKAVLTSPMLKLSFGVLSPSVIKLLTSERQLTGREKKAAAGAAPWSDKEDFENSCATSPARYRYVHGLQQREEAYRLTSASNGWLAAALKATKQVFKDADRVRIPVLICQAGLETLVDNGGQDEFASKAANARVLAFPKAKHEIYLSTEEVLADYYKAILDHFEA